MYLEVRKLLCASPLRLGEEVEVEHCAIPEGYTVGAEVFVKTWSESLGRAIEIFECPLCHDYDFVARGETLYRHGCGALLVLYRHPRKDILVLP
ncbi:hypothetical protein BH24DEI1_BH24DEI1_20360 [soil metagenome]|nr:hypothetical protein [Deinococcota bacterium]